MNVKKWCHLGKSNFLFTNNTSSINNGPTWKIKYWGCPFFPPYKVVLFMWMCCKTNWFYLSWMPYFCFCSCYLDLGDGRRGLQSGRGGNQFMLFMCEWASTAAERRPKAASKCEQCVITFFPQLLLTDRHYFISLIHLLLQAVVYFVFCFHYLT